QLGSLRGDDDPQGVAELLPHTLRDRVRGPHRGEVDHQLDAAVGGVHSLAAGTGSAREAPRHGVRGNHDPAASDHVAIHTNSVPVLGSLDRIPATAGGRSPMSDQADPTQEVLRVWEGVAPGWERYRERLFESLRPVSDWLIEAIAP